MSDSKSQKLKRGQAYVIRMGPAYYAGTRPEKVLVKVAKDGEWSTRQLSKPRYQRGLVSRPMVNPNKKAGEKNKRWSNYWGGEVLDQPKKPYKVTVNELAPSAKYVDDWAEDIKQAKKFRLESKALAKAEELVKMLGLVKTKIHVELIKE